MARARPAQNGHYACRMGRRRAGVFLVSLLMAAAPAKLAAGQEPPATPPGYSTVRVRRAGFSIDVPDSWVVLDLTRKPFKAQVRDLAKNYANLADYFSSDVFSHDAGLRYTAMFAADGTSNAPTRDNVRVEHYRQPGGNPVDHMKEIGSVLRRLGAQDIEVTKVSVAGKAGVEAAAFHPRGPYPVHETSY